jgi:hypothetical protein
MHRDDNKPAFVNEYAEQYWTDGELVKSFQK